MVEGVQQGPVLVGTFLSTCSAPPAPQGALLSQAERVEAPAIDGPLSRVHVLRVRYHSALPLLWPRAVHKLRSKLTFVPSIHLFEILRPLPSLKQLFRRWLMRPLSEFLSALYHLWPVNYKCDVNICCMLELFYLQHFRTDEGFVLKPKRLLWHITLGIIDHDTNPPGVLLAVAG